MSSSYQTLLGAYRMSGSSAVLPPATATGSSNISSSQQQQQRPGTGSRDPTLVQYRVSSTQQQHQQAAAVHTQSLQRKQSAGVVRSSAAAAASSSSSSAKQQYLSTGSSSSSSSAAARQPLQQAAVDYARSGGRPSMQASKSGNNTNASAALTQAERTSSSSSSSSRSQQLVQNAHHHKMRSSMYRPKWDPELRRHPLQHRPLLILDLDETLVHASTQRTHKYDFAFDVDMGANQAPVPVWVGIRPYAREFLYDVSSYFEIAVFTASIKNYADKVVEALDPSGQFIHHKLYRDHCSDVDGVFVKDLSLLGRPLSRVAILDNSPHAYLFHPENSIPILSWFDDPQDRELRKMVPMLVRDLAQADHVYDVLQNYRDSM